MHIGVKMSCPSLLHATFSKAKNCWKPVAYSKCTPKRGAQSVRRSVMMGLMSWSTVSDKTCEKSHTTSLTCSLQCHVTGCIISIMSVVCLHFYLCHPLNFLFFFFASGCLPTSFTLAHPNQMSHPQHTPLPHNTPWTSLRALYRWTRRSRPARVDYAEWTKSLYSYFNAKKSSRVPLKQMSLLAWRWHISHHSQLATVFVWAPRFPDGSTFLAVKKLRGKFASQSTVHSQCTDYIPSFT